MKILNQRESLDGLVDRFAIQGQALSDDTILNIKEFLNNNTDRLTIERVISDLIPHDYYLTRTSCYYHGTQINGFSLSHKEEPHKSLLEAYERYLFLNLALLADINNESNNASSYLKLLNVESMDLSKTNVINLNSLEEVSLERYLLGLQSNFSSFTSNGCAVHTSVLNSTKASIFELLENHIIQEHIMLDIAPVEVHVDELIPTSISAKLNEHGFEIKTLCFTNGQWPTFLTFILNKDLTGPYLFYGIGCHEDLDQGLQKSIREAFMCWCIELPQISALDEVDLGHDISKSSKFYHYQNSEVMQKAWFGMPIKSIEEIKLQYPTQKLAAVIKEMDFLILPILAQGEKGQTIVFTKVFSCKNHPKSYSTPPYLRIHDTLNNIDKLKNYPF